MATQAAISVQSNSDDKSFTFSLTAYEASGGTWAVADVKSPYIKVTGGGFSQKLSVPLYNADTVPTSGNIGAINTQDKLTMGGLTSGVEYQVAFYCVNGSTTAATYAKTNMELILPTGAPILGTGSWATSNLKVNMTISDSRVTQMMVEAYNMKSGTDNSKTFTLSATQVNNVRSNGYHIFDLAAVTGWTLPATGDKIKIVATATDGNDYSDEAIREYDLVVKPTAPTAITVSDYRQAAASNDTDGSLNTLKLLTASVTVAANQVFEKLEILASDAYGKYTNVIKSVSYDATKVGGVYANLLLSVELGSVTKYAARVVTKAGVASDELVTGSYVIDLYIDPKPVLSAKRLTSGHDAAHPASTHDLFEISLQSGVSSYERRFISDIQVKAGSITSYTNIAANMRPTSWTVGTNGTWDVAADGSAKFLVYTAILTNGQQAEFRIAANALDGYYTEFQQVIGGAATGVQNMNAAAIETKAIKIEYPLIAPNDPSNVLMTAQNAGVMVRWDRLTGANSGNDNNKATSFIVNIYGKQHFTLNETPLYSVEVEDEYAMFSGLTNDHTYWASVSAKNAKDFSSVIRSAAGATPLASILTQLLTIDSSKFADPSCNFVVSMQTSAVVITSITVQEIDVNGINIGTATVQSVAKKAADTYTIVNDAQGSTYGTKYFYIFATSTAVAASAGVPVVSSNTPFLFTSIETGKKPTIGTMTFTKKLLGTVKTTEVSVDINNQFSALTLAKIVAIPAAPGADEDHYDGSVIFDLIKGASVSSSLTNFTYKVTLPYHVALVNSDKEMATVLAANALGNAQSDNFA